MIQVKRTPETDTRTAITIPTKEELRDSTISHIGDVQNGCSFFAKKLIDQSMMHDNTKLKYFENFYEDFVGRAGDTRKFEEKSWWQKHLTERHHLNDRVPEDVNLIDIFEMVVDCTMAGMARSGNVFDISLNPVTVQRAIENTKKLLMKEIELVGSPYGNGENSKGLNSQEKVPNESITQKEPQK